MIKQPFQSKTARDPGEGKQNQHLLRVSYAFGKVQVPFMKK